MTAESPIDVWNSLLRPDVELSGAFHAELVDRMRAARLTFGDRLLCPFLRPFFVDRPDLDRVRLVSEAIASIGERVVTAAVESPELLAQFALTEEETRLAAIDPGYARASTASRLDAFLLPDSLQFAEYNAESPAGLGYAQTMAQLFHGLPIMDRFRERFDVQWFPLMESILDALLASYAEWGGRASPPTIAIVDWRDVPTWSEFQMLRERFTDRGVPTVVVDPQSLEFSGGRLIAEGRAIDLVYRRVLINDIIARPEECAALIKAYEARAVCVANTLRCKIPHKKTFFAVLTDDRNASLFDEEERALIRRHIPWTRVVRDGRTTRDGATYDLLPYVRAQRETLVMKPADEYGGAGVTLGWETDAGAWDRAIETAIAEPASAWIVQERIAVRREVFPRFTLGEGVRMVDMLVDFAPYLFRGRLSGFLTRLSATGLANVTSGGGQVPAFVVTPAAARAAARA